MARGWESKSVESQIESAAERQARVTPQRSREELEREQKRENLALDRARVKRELENCHTPRYAEVLNRSLAFLDEEISKL